MAWNRWWLAASPALLLACTPDGAAPAADSYHASLAAMEVRRTGAARLSVTAFSEACGRDDRAGADSGGCDAAGTEVTGARERALTQLAARARRDTSADAAHVLALLDLLWPTSDDAVYRASRLLETASASRGGDATMLADLSAAHLLRAARTADPRAPLEALEAALHALELDARHPVAAFNAALALERVGLVRQAVRAWRSYLAVDSAGGWASEARERVLRLERARDMAPGKAGDGHAAARRHAQGVRERAWDTVLVEWADAALAEDSARAASRLHDLRSAGLALADLHRDSSLLHLHAELETMADAPARRARAARAVTAHGRARQLYVSGDYHGAGAAWDAIDRQAAPQELRPWIALFHAATLTYRGRPEAGAAAVSRLLATHDDGRRPAIAGRAHWVRGTTLLRTGQAREALAAYERAEARFDHAGEKPNAAAVLALQAEALLILGDEAAAAERAHRAIAGLLPWGPSVWLRNLLLITSQAAARSGLHRVSRAIADEDVEIAAALPVPIYEVEARISRAGFARLSGQEAQARRDLEMARRQLDGVRIPMARAWLMANLRLAEASLEIEHAPGAALAAFDTALVLVGPRELFRRLPALVGRGRALLALDSVAAADRAHREAMAALRLIDGGPDEVSQRRLVLGDLDRLTTRLAGRLLADGDTVGALLATERSRSRVGGAQPTRAVLSAAASPRRHVTIAYAFIADTLVAWRLGQGSMMAVRRPVLKHDIVSATAEVNARLALGMRDRRTDSLLVRLHRWLVAGLLPAGRDSALLTVVADGEVADAPFAALRDGATGRYLVEEVELRFAPSVLPGRPRRIPRLSGPATAIGVADGDEARGLAPLEGAERESRQVASLYEGGRVLVSHQASAARVAEALARSRLVHMAAHAVADPVRPLESVVLLREGERLAARQVAEMDLAGLELAVLAACDTQRGGPGGAGALAGLSWAFLRAGAGGVIGSTWRVDDAATQRLMLTLHRRHASGIGASAALRLAQLDMLRDGDPRWRSPSSWAAFRYATVSNH